MPMILDTLPTSATGTFSPLRSKIEELIVSCGTIDKHIAMMNEDMETCGVLTEETYFYDAPELLTHLAKISRVAALCTQDIYLDDEVFEIDQSQLALVLYNFISDHRRILDQLTALGNVMKSTGSLYGALGGALQRQQLIVKRFREMLDSKYALIKFRTAPDWINQAEAMRRCLEAYPAPGDENYPTMEVTESV